MKWAQGSRRTSLQTGGAGQGWRWSESVPGLAKADRQAASFGTGPPVPARRPGALPPLASTAR